MYVTIVTLIVWAICIAFIFNEGMWGAALMFFNVLFAAVIAANFFEPVANWLDGMAPSFTYLWDFLAVWAVFAIALLIMRLATDFLSRHRVKFKKIVDLIGGVAFAALAGLVMVMFVTFTLTMAPLGPSILGSEFPPDPRAQLRWAQFIHFLSEGSMSRESPEHVFDVNSETPSPFVLRYHVRRQRLEKEPGNLVDTKRQVEPYAAPATPP